MPFYDNYLSSERASSTRLGRWLVRYRNNWFVKKITALTKKEKVSILEIGPGKGDFAILCLERKWEYLGIEGNQLMFDRLRERNIRVLNRYVPPFDLEQRFDVIFLNQVFEHMESRAQAIHLVQEIHDTLNDMGIVVISSPEIIFWGQNFFAGDYTHNNPTSYYNLKQILSDFHFNIIEVTFYTLIFEGYYLCKILTSVYNLLFAISILDLIFGREKAYKIKTALLPSVVLVARKKA
jgi:SAM-dependent methyltransferase